MAKSGSKGGCRVLYLRVAVGALNAFFVFAVAAIALIVTATASLKALNDNGEAHVAALGNAATFRVSTFFDRPQQQAIALATQALAESFTLPAGDKSARLNESERDAANVPIGGVELQRVTTAVSQSMFDYKLSLFATAYWMADGTRAIVFPIPQVQNAVYLEKWWRNNVTDALDHRETIMYDTTTGLRINNSDPRHGIFMPLRENVTLTDAQNPPTFATLSGLVNLGRDQPVKWSLPRFFHETVAYRYILASKAVYNATTLLGFAFSGVTLGRIGAELDGVRSSPESIVLVTDASGYVLGSSGGIETFNVTSYAGAPLAQGCASTDQTRSTVPSDQRLMSCMHHIRDFSVPVVRKIAATHTLSSKAEQFKIKSGSTFFARIQPVTGVGLQAFIIVIVPEKEILGDVAQSIWVAGAITAAAIVVAAAACFGLVWWLLHPLQGIAVRMGKAARLEEDPDEVAISAFVEIGDLQRAFVEMRDELDRIRSYVPQSLLRAADSDEEEELLDMDAEKSLGSSDVKSPPQHRNSSRGSVSQFGASRRQTTRQSHAGTLHGSGAMSVRSTSTVANKHGVKIVEGLRRENVSVLSLNVCGFHNFFGDGRKAQRSAVTSLVDAVLASAQGEKGVVDSFHGDRFSISFNAVKPAANHGIRATVTAMLVVEAAKKLGLAVTAGVGTGPAQVGNMGTKGMMRFTIIGPVVAQSVTLERLCKLYSTSAAKPSAGDGKLTSAALDGTAMEEIMDADAASPRPPDAELVHCLVPQRLLQDLATSVSLRTVDYVRLPQAKNACLIAAVDRLLGGEGEDEWMYQLEARGAGDVANCPTAAANAAWNACVREEFAEAQQLATALDALAEKFPDDAKIQKAAACPRLRANCQVLSPRDFGEFYRCSLLNAFN